METEAKAEVEAEKLCNSVGTPGGRRCHGDVEDSQKRVRNGNKCNICRREQINSGIGE